MSEMVENVTRAVAAALKAHCTNRLGECYAHGFNGPCPQEGGWPGEVDGEFDLEVIARAAIEAMREPTEAMFEAGYRIEHAPQAVWITMIDAALTESETTQDA